MTRRYLWAALALLALGSAGCANGQFTLFRPGTSQQQRLRATVHDPYPDTDKGSGQMADARPRDYQQQSPEPVRNRFFTDSWWGR